MLVKIYRAICGNPHYKWPDHYLKSTIYCRPDTQGGRRACPNVYGDRALPEKETGAATCSVFAVLPSEKQVLWVCTPEAGEEGKLRCRLARCGL